MVFGCVAVVLLPTGQELTRSRSIGSESIARSG